MKSSTQYMQPSLCSSLANLYLLGSSMLTHELDHREYTINLEVKNLLAPILLKLAIEVIANRRVDHAEMAGTRRLGFLNSTVDLALSHFLTQHTSSHTASLCILLRLIPPHNQANHLPGHWYQ
jgi:hypothetical protein